MFVANLGYVASASLSFTNPVPKRKGNVRCLVFIWHCDAIHGLRSQLTGNSLLAWLLEQGCGGKPYHAAASELYPCHVLATLRLIPVSKQEKQTDVVEMASQSQTTEKWWDQNYNLMSCDSFKDLVLPGHQKVPCWSVGFFLRAGNSF